METSDNTLSHGNLLDDLGFETTTPLPSDGEGRFIIEKRIVGLDETEAERLIRKGFISYKIGTESDWTTVSSMELTKNTDGSFTATYTANITVPANSAGVEVIVKEDQTKAGVEGYELNTDGTDEKRVTVQERETQTVSFTNTYTSTEPPQPDTGTLIVKKTVSGGGADYNKAFTFKVELEMSRPEAEAVALMSDMLNNGDPSGDEPSNIFKLVIDGVTFEGNGEAFVGTFPLKP